MDATAITVRVPATSANLGAGFDCLGLALDLVASITVSFSEAEALPPDDVGEKMVITAARQTYQRLGRVPPAGIRAVLGTLALELQRSCGGRAMAAERIHLTLNFLGETPRALIPRLAAEADRLQGRRFELLADHAGYWRHNRIVWAGAAQCPLPLRRLVDALAVALQPHGFQREERSYTPHVTLLRDARRAPKTGLAQSIEWPIEAFVLVQSVRRERMPGYDILKRWPLRYAAGER